MSIYSNVLLPLSYDFIMDSDVKGKARSRQLSQVCGEILEIGFGTGLNLPHYPTHVQKITSVDPNPGMNHQAAKKAKKFDIEVDSYALSGEHLPFADNRFDSVVTSYTLCSINNVMQALQEIRRVLRPSGHYYFLEHGLSRDHPIQKWQHRINPLQKVISDGCQLVLDINRLIIDAGFEIVNLEEYYMADDPKTHGYMYQGIAKRHSIHQVTMV